MSDGGFYRLVILLALAVVALALAAGGAFTTSDDEAIDVVHGVVCCGFFKACTVRF